MWPCLGVGVGLLVTLIPSIAADHRGLVDLLDLRHLIQASSTGSVAITAKTGTSAAVGLYVTSFYVGGTFGGYLPGLGIRGRRLAVLGLADRRDDRGQALIVAAAWRN